MNTLSLILGWLVPIASAKTLETAGQGGVGIDAMWSSICSVLPCSVQGPDLVSFFGAKIVRFIFPMVSVVAVIMVIYAGIKIVTSDGSDDKVSEAKKIIMYAVGGVILSMLATAILNFVIGYLGIALG